MSRPNAPGVSETVRAVGRYIVPTVLALGVHGAVIGALWRGFSPSAEEHIIAPPTIQATLVALEPTLEKPEPVAAPSKPTVDEVALAKGRAEADRQRQEAERLARLTADRAAKETAQRERDRLAKERAERERLAREKAERLANERRLADERMAQLEAEARAQAIASEQAQLTAVAGQRTAVGFIGKIRADVERNWSRPPSATNDMQVLLTINLVPSGEVVSVSVTRSSGHDSFDRSAVAAVHKARRFTVPDDARVFETYFRRFQLLFQPEDLDR